MIHETITFKFADEAQQRRFHDKLNTHCRREESEDASGEIDRLRAALTEISKGEGAFSRLPIEHAQNCIENMKQIALDALNN